MSRFRPRGAPRRKARHISEPPPWVVDEGPFEISDRPWRFVRAVMDAPTKTQILVFILFMPALVTIVFILVFFARAAFG
jgi:hypothetical protein